MTRIDGLALYTRTAREASDRVIGSYSTSFRLASKLLAPDVRMHIAVIYALVRVADELVDGTGAEAGLSDEETRELLDSLEEETLAAVARGYSTDLVVHAFARTAREVGITEKLIRPFFASMRTDIDGDGEFDEPSYRRYIHGSAEVVGLMCLRAFLQEDRTVPLDEDLEEGARRLGAAFQKVNFLRDIADDATRLGRCYLPGVDLARFTEADKHAVADDIDADLTIARAAIVRLPPRARRATLAAAGLFARLNHQIRSTPADELLVCRVSVPSAQKARVLARAALGRSTL
ncbi:phytoene/squalene synthase family protein [Microbacterium amylolyticum]|uniref:Phytoene/squalene synthetase n=1 Tax=Microbacterium amylolyticum TaxID=936337 RepID=A0ABS4ZFR5_9MICO|nr:squalene/phytoene synthase family protein [Microbacterium amylolyticum]MBP2435873.1 phytoene/squalene synthetase [Microbacterium amylolyticum]